MKNKLILTDCDGVLLDWGYGFTKWMAQHHGMQQKNFDVYGVHNMYEIEKSLGKKYVRAFNESANCGWLPPYRDAVKYVKKIHEDFGMMFTVVTSFSDNPYAQKLRVDNLNRVFGENVFDDIIMLGTGDDKDDALEHWKDSGCFWIEDKPANVQAGVKAGLRSILMRNETNQESHDVDDGTHLYIGCWESFYNHVKLHQEYYKWV